jgi:hypothetical protein
VKDKIKELKIKINNIIKENNTNINEQNNKIILEIRNFEKYYNIDNKLIEWYLLIDNFNNNIANPFNIKNEKEFFQILEEYASVNKKIKDNI